MRAGFSANPCSFVKTLWRLFHFRAAKPVRKFQVDNIKPLFKQSPPCSGESIQKLAFPRPVYTWHRVLRTHNSHAISTNFEGVLLKRCNPRCSCSLQIHCFLASNVQAVLCHLRSKCAVLTAWSCVWFSYRSCRTYPWFSTTSTQLWSLPGWYACVCLCNAIRFHLPNACESNCDPICP